MTDWTNEPGTLIWIACTQRTVVWGLDEDNEIWFHTAGQIEIGDELTDVVWDPVPGKKMIKLDVGRDGSVVGLDENAEVWWRMNITPTERKGDSWET